VLYNAGSLPSRTYSAGQALFDAHDPTKLVARSDSAFIKPTESYERTGQYTAGTTFVEGLVPIKGRWFLYYGTADSRVGVAVWDPQSPAAAILGAWHGTSLCADKQVDVACHDEEVIYVIDSAAGPRGPVRWQADKIVNGVRENMGVSSLSYDSTSDTWFWDLNMRVRGRFTFRLRGDSLVGDLREGSSHRLVRRIAVGRCSARILQCPK